MSMKVKGILLAGVAAAALSAGNAWAAPPASAWTGFYFGANGGFGGGADNVTFNNYFFTPYTYPPSQPNLGQLGGAGGLAGVQAGFDSQFGRMVLGIVGDADVASIHGDRYFGGKASYTPTPSYPYFGGKGNQHVWSHYSWLSTIRGRVGIPMGNVMPFVTGGVAFAGIDNGYSAINNYNGFNSVSSSGTRVGWVLGIGGEMMVTPTVSLQAQFLHTDFGSQTLSIPSGMIIGSGTVKFDNALNVFTAGVNVRFP